MPRMRLLAQAEKMKLCLSSVETRFGVLPDSVLDKASCILESFFYIRPEMMDYCMSRPFFIMDSGAFTFRENVKRQVSYKDFVEYTIKFADFIKRYDIHFFFEMDVDNLIGLPKVEELRSLLEHRAGRQCIPVWHIERGREYFVDMCKAYPYVAIGGIAGGTREQYANYQKYFPWFIQTAHQYKAKIHGLGFTPSNLHRYAFDSVDSSSWLSGGRYGTLHRFDGRRIRTIRPSGKRAKDYKQIDEHNFLEWCLYQRYLERI